MKRIIFLTLLSILTVLATACGRREPVEEPEYEAQWENGAGFAVGSLTVPSEEGIHENLALLGKVWGFAKYHHPIFLTGQLCWDAELLKLVPPVLEGGDVREILYGWFVGLGKDDYDFPYGVYFNLENLLRETEYEKARWGGYGHAALTAEMYGFVVYFTGKAEGELDWNEFRGIMEDRFPLIFNTILKDEEGLRPMADLTWINYENLGPLAEHLLRTGGIRVIGRRGAPVRFLVLVGNLDFSNQHPRGAMQFDDPGERLLALFRLWNAMNYYFPHHDVMDVPWNDLLPRFVPKMLEGTDRLSYEATLAALAHYLHCANVFIDGTPFFSRKFGDVAAPVQLIPAEGQLVVYRVGAEGIPLQRGDVILSLNGRDVGEIVSEMKPFISYPNDEKALTVLGGIWPFPYWFIPGFPHVLTSNERFMDISVLRGRFGLTVSVMGSRMRTATMPRWIGTHNARIPETSFVWTRPQSATPHGILDGNIGFLNPSLPVDVRYAMESFADTDGIVIDFRNRPFGPFILYNHPHTIFTSAMLDYLIEEPLPYLLISRPSQVNPGFRYDYLHVNLFTCVNPYAFLFDRSVVLIMDEQTSVYSESAIMSLRAAPNVTVVGTNSMGILGGSAVLPLPGAISIRFKSVGAYTPQGGQIHRVGLTPDIRVDRTIQGITDGRDEIMEAAIQFVLGER